MPLKLVDERRCRELGNAILSTLRALVQQLDSIKIQLDSISKKGNTDEEEQQPHPPEPIRVIPQIPVAITEYYESQNSKDKRLKWWRRAKVTIEIIGIGAVVGYAVITYEQWGTMSNALIEAKKQTAIMQAGQRPWLGLAGQVRITTGPKFRFFNPNFTNLLLEGTYAIKNFGTSPAFGENSMTMVVIQSDTVNRPSKTGLNMICPDRDAKLSVGEVVFPGSGVVNGFSQQTSFGKNITELGRVWLLGCISYQDGDHKLHHTRFWLRSTHPDDSQWTKENIGRPFQHMPITGFESWGEEAD